MAQLMQIRLQRYDAQPWGFRLQGGKDFAAPLVVQKINGGSLAEQAGLLPGDAVIKINDIDVYNLRHKEAQDLVVRSGNNFVVTVQRGGLTWRPSVTPTGQMPSPNPYSNQIPTVTKTSLAHKPQEVHHIGSGYNNSARPFSAVNGNDGQVKSIVNKQYNTPVGIYSDETIAETLSAQAEVLAGGVLGINFKKNEKQYQADKSEVLKFLHEEETGDYQEPAQYSPPQTNNNHIPSQNQSTVTSHVSAPINRPKPPSTGGLPAGQNICTECERLIVGVFVRIKDKNLHVECFKCATCGTSLKNQGYYNFNNKLYCDIHARLAALQNPPSGTEGYVPVPIKPNTKLSASTISAALNSIGYNGTATNGTSTPSYSAPPSNTETTSIPDLPLPPPPSPTQLQQFQIQEAFCNGNNIIGNNTAISNHSRTNSSLSTASSSSLSLSPYSSTNGINNNSCSPVNSIENTLNNHNGYNNSNSNNNNSLSTLSLDRFASSTTSSPGHSRQQSTSSSIGSGNATDFQFPPPPPPPLPQYNSTQQHHQQHQHLQQNSMTINQSGKQNENDMNSNNRYVTSMASSNTTNGGGAQTNGVSSVTGQGTDIPNGRADDSIKPATDSRMGQGQGQGSEQFQYVTLHGNVIRSVIPPGKGAPVNYKVNQGYARPYGAPAPAPAAAPKSPTSYPPPTQGGHWGQQRPAQQPASNPYATLPRSNPAPQEPITNSTYKPAVPMTTSTLPRMKPSIAKPNPDLNQASEATQMLTESIGKVNIGNKNNFMAEAGKIISSMLEARLANGSKNNSTTDLTTISNNNAAQTRSPMVMRKRFELDDFKNVDPTAPADLKPTQVVVQAESKFQPPPPPKPSAPVVTGDVLTQQNHHMKNLIEICDAKRVLNPVLNGNKPAMAVSAKPTTVVTSVAVPVPPPQPPLQQKAQPQVPVQGPPTELAPLETVIFRNKNRSANKGGELSTHATDRRSYIEKDSQSDNAPVFEISVKPMGSNNTDGEAGIDETKAVVSQLLKDGKRPICCQCDKEISRGPFITALGRIWCPDHFMCVNANCRRPLQDIGFVEEKGDLYCEYCFEKYLAPTCSKCAGKIKGDCLNAIGRHFHPECFTCAHCGKLFGNTPFFLEEGMAYCEADWNELFTTKCFACGFPVEAGDRWVEALNHNYHSQCFNCTYCKKNLEGQSFYNKGGRPFCKNHAR